MSKPIQLRWSSMKTFMECHRRYALSYRDFLGKKAGKESQARILGSLVHAGIHAALLASFAGVRSDRELVDKAVNGVRQWSADNTDLRRTTWDGKPDPDYFTMMDQRLILAIEIVRYQVPRIGLGTRWRVPSVLEVLSNYQPGRLAKRPAGRHEPFAEWHFSRVESHPSTGNEYELTGTVDSVLQDTETGQYVMFDWKTRGQMPQESLVDLDGQLKFYAAITNSLGANITETCQYQIRNLPPKQAKLTPKKQQLSLSDIVSTWEVWSESVRGLGLDPEKYRGQMAENLRDDSYFINPVYTPVTPRSSAYIIRTALDIGEAIRFGEETGNFPMMPAINTCQFCDYRRICAAEIYGSNTSTIIQQDYVYGVNPEEDEEL